MTSHELAGDLSDRRLLIVDDEPANILLLEKILRRAGYTAIEATTSPRQALARFHELAPDLLLLDVHMPEMTGIELMQKLRLMLEKDQFFPILVLTGDTSSEAKQRALRAGATDFVGKPFDPTEALLRIKNLLDTQTLHRQVRAENQRLEVRVQQRTRELDEARMEVLRRLSTAAEFRDDDTGQHTQRVGQLALHLARTLGLEKNEADLLGLAAPLHDVGKIGIPDAILLKPGRLTTDEFAIMAGHTTIGGQILSGSHSPLLRVAEEIALSHHEAWDGSGYPQGLIGEAIPLSGQIVSIADVFDALTHERPYKHAWPLDAAVREILSLAGSKFNPRLVRAFRSVERQGILERILANGATPAALSR